MKMRPSVLNTFPIACCLMSLVLNGAGELLILQEPEKAIDNTGDGIRYTCISEDDGTALVWNHDLKYCDPKQDVAKELRSIPIRNVTKCALVESKNCTAYWKESVDWKIVNSRDYPTGPVFDSRWEDFAETSFREANQDHKNYQYVMKMTKSSNVVFSVQGPQIISIRICEKNNTEDGSCTTITLGKSDNYCTFTNFGGTDEHACTNTDRIAESEKNLLSKHVWRTFILDWYGRNIAVRNEYRRLFGILLEQGSGLQDKYFFLNMGDEGLVRFHFYDYLLAREGTTLESDKFYNDEQNLCFEFIAGLCNACYLEIYVVDVKGISQRLKIIYPFHFSGINGMLTWQRVILNETLKHDYKGQLSLKIKSGFDYEPSFKLRWAISWAIGTLGKCKSPDAGRELSFIKVVSQIPSEVQEVHHCQKMSYDPTESFAVSSYFTTASRNISASMQEYLRRTSYKQAPCPSNWWERTSICGQSGCVCIEKISNIVTTGPKLSDIIANEEDSGSHKTSNFSLSEEMIPKFSDEETLLEQTKTWFVILPILVICLLLPYVLICCRRHKKSQGRKIHLQGILSDQLYVNPDNSRVQSIHAQDPSSGPVNTKISENVKEQTIHVHDISPDPVYSIILDDPSEQTSHKQNVPSDPLYMTPINPKTKTDNTQKVSLGTSAYMNIPNNLKEQASHKQNILPDPVYTMISENFNEQTMLVHDVTSDPVYFTILDDPSQQTSHKQNVPSDPLYMIPIDPKKQTNNAQEVSLTPVYMHIPNNLKEQASHEQNILPDPVYTMILENSNEQTMHVHDVSSDPVYSIISDDSSEQTSRKQNVPSDPLYMTPIDPKEQINNAQEVSLAPVYMNIPNNLKEQSSHEQAALPFLVI